MRMQLLFALLAGLPLLALCIETRPPLAPPGEEPTAKTQTLKSGAAVLQLNAPLTGMDVYLVGFHPMRDHPEHQMEAHHFCRQVNQDFAQCVLFDGNTSDANMTGVEYIISETLFESLPRDEKALWHPHNFEILSGQLIAPGIPVLAERELMEDKMNSYGKTWHFWASDRGDRLPLGPPMLAWSFNRIGEAQPGLVERRDERFNLDSGEKRESREELTLLAKPQMGVDDLKGKFGRPTSSLPGVVDVRSARNEEARPAKTGEPRAAKSADPAQPR